MKQKLIYYYAENSSSVNVHKTFSTNQKKNIEGLGWIVVIIHLHIF